MNGDTALVVSFYVISIIFPLLILIGQVWYIKAYIKRYYYDVAESFITIKKGVFTPAEIHVQYGKIQDVYVDQDLLDRMLGIYDVHIASATVTSGIEAHIDGVNQASAEGLKTLLLNKISGRTQPPVDQSSSVSSAQSNISSDPVFNSGEDISSEVYPISSKYLPISFFQGFFVSLVLAPVFSIFIGSKSLSRGDSFEWGPFLLLAVLIFAIIFIWHIVYVVIWKKNFRFKFMPNFIHTHSSVLSKVDRQLPYSSIQDVTVSQGLLESFFGLCTVVIANAVQSVRDEQSIKLPGQVLENGNKIATIIRNSILSTDRSKTGL